jgi:Xaa-Pro aminopeptidase
VHNVGLASEPAGVPHDEYVARLSRGANAARDSGLDGLLVWGLGGSPERPHDLFYFTGHYSPMPWIAPAPAAMRLLENHVLVLTADGEAVLCVCGFSGETVSVDEVRPTFDLTAELASVIAELGLDSARLGLVAGELMPFLVGQELTSRFRGLRLEPADDLAHALRRHLSAVDVTMLTHAAAVGCAIFDAILASVSPGSTEADAVGAGLAETARYEACLHGGLLVASGPDASWYLRRPMPSWNPSYVYRPGDLFHADLYGFVNGYPYDLQRTVEVGGSDTLALASAAARACDRLAASLRPGITPRELHALGLGFLADEGAALARTSDEETVFGPSFGHAIGVGFLRPYLVPQGTDAHEPLVPPLGLCFETFVTDGQGRHAGHEDMYLWLDEGVSCLSREAAL